MQGKTIIVSGGFGVLGEALVRRLADAGAQVAVIDRSEVRRIPGAALEIGEVDSADPAGVADAVAQVLEKFDAIHGLANVAGGFRWETLLDGEIDTWDALYRANLRSAVVMCKAVAPSLAQVAGSIVNVGAAATSKAAAGLGAYAASKSGVARLTESLAGELMIHGVRANAVLPSIIDTPANRHNMPNADFASWVKPEALANVIAFLLSTEAEAITGASIPVLGKV